MFVPGRPQIHAGRQGRSEMFYHYQKNVLCFGSSVYLWETQARAMMCAACSTHVCFALTFPPKRRPLLKKFGFFSTPPTSQPPLSFCFSSFQLLTSLFSPHCHYIAIFPLCLAQCCCELCPQGSLILAVQAPLWPAWPLGVKRPEA